MSGVWCLTSRNREDMAKRFVQSCVPHEAILWCDGCSYDFDHDWLQIESEHIGIGAAMNRVFEMYPDADFYGWLADDLIPHTKGWDVELAKTAEDRYLVSCNDMWLRGRKDDGSPWVTGAICLGGDLVRAMGWWAPPGMFQMYIDTVWVAVARRFDLLRYRDDIVVEHLHRVNKKREPDQTDRDNPRVAQDRIDYEKYKNDEGLMQRVEALCKA